MSYICECGVEFEHPQKFNGHKGHCKIHLAAVGKLDTYADRQARASATGRTANNLKRAQTKKQALIAWLASAPKCVRCNKLMTEKFGSGKFCSRACANTRAHSVETKQKIQQSVTEQAQSKHIEAKQAYALAPNYCTICGNILPYALRFRSTCSEDCFHEAASAAGRHAATKIAKRSKNEINFCTLCEDYFGIENVLHNEPLFNGWDADIILVDQKVAILWNGPWHYRKVTEQHSLEQVQVRDQIKIAEIIKAGFTPYIIEDSAKKSKNSVEVQEEFFKLLKFLNIAF